MTEFAELVTAARRLADSGDRRILGITGPPAAGKSTLATRLVAALDGRAVEVGMDGFHYAQRNWPGWAAPNARARRTRSTRSATWPCCAGPDVVYAPRFRRDIEEPVGSAVSVP
jgi:pantothenate kinase